MSSLETERDRLKGELSRCRLQLAALESMLATNEHLVLRAPALSIWDVADLGAPPWGTAPMIEEWRVRLDIQRHALTGAHRGHHYANGLERWIREVHVHGGERLMFAALSPPRRV